MIGNSPKLKVALAAISRASVTDCNVLITGESGTGKELAVRELHRQSRRNSNNLVAVNCGAISENLIESELFGHAKGAFTGAHAAKEGRVSLANKGTLFLDEVGDMPLSMQVKLLRLLQFGEYTLVGESITRVSDLRIVCATHKNLEAEVQAGRFREDLFYRLNVVSVEMPALRDRGADIDLLSLHFLRTIKSKHHRSDLIGFDVMALDLLRKYHWPGNIRELENTIESLVIMSAGPLIRVSDLTGKFTTSRSAPPPPRPVETEASAAEKLKWYELEIMNLEGRIDLRKEVDGYETRLILQALEQCKWNKNQAAKLLGVNRTTLVEMIKRKQLAEGVK